MGGREGLERRHNHRKIKRAVGDVPCSIRSVTTSDDPKFAELIRKHVWQMKDRVERGPLIRPMDPLFREIFRHADKIRAACG